MNSKDFKITKKTMEDGVIEISIVYKPEDNWAIIYIYCDDEENNGNGMYFESEYSELNGPLSGIDDLNRRIEKIKEFISE